MEKLQMVGYFNKVETTEEHQGYIHSVGRALTIVILGSLCKLEDLAEIHQWAKDEKTDKFLSAHFGIYTIPTYPWLLRLLGIIRPESLNKLFIEWTKTLVPKFLNGLTISFDGKTICSTGKMQEYERPLHILSAYLVEQGLTLGQQTVAKKSNKIPAMRELIKLIDIRGCMVVADALHCQAETAKEIVDAGGDYLLNVKGNQETLELDIKDYVTDDALRQKMDSAHTIEKNGGRIEYRQAFVTDDVLWMGERIQGWKGLVSIGAINRRFTMGEKTTDEWHFYISSRKLTAENLLKYARNEWGVEAMHW
jgi:predicted transposase YbfD/YdcC